MRSIVCRFKDEADFLHHLRNGYSSRGPAFVFVARIDLEPGQTVDFHGLVSNRREDLKVKASIFERTPVALDDGGSSVAYRYVCVVDPNDAIWVEMFEQKMAMMRGMAAAA